MGVSGRALELARLAAALAAGAGVELPDHLALWRLAGERPAAAPVPAIDPASRLGDALERGLSARQRQRGAHYTPGAVADRVAELALRGHPASPLVVDPACGGGALLLAAGRRLLGEGVSAATVSQDLLWGADIDPLAVAVTQAGIALWSGGTAPASGHLVVSDTLGQGSGAWPAPPAAGFDVVIGNPPFQGQLSRTTARRADEAVRLRERFGGAAAAPYVDTAALFLLVASELARPGGRMALVQPQSVVASRDARGVRELLAHRARLVELWAPPERLFEAKVHVCVPVLERSQPDRERPGSAAGGGGAQGKALPGREPSGPDGLIGADHAAGEWSSRWADARGIPRVHLGGPGTVADMATARAGFRDEYYGLVGHIVEAGPDPRAPLVTSGLIDLGRSSWGERPARFAKRRWGRPEVDLVSLRGADRRVSEWVDGVRRPKVVVASQTRVVEAAIDQDGTWVPSTPVVSVMPLEVGRLAHVAAVLCAPPVSAWAARRAAGTALSAEAMRISAGLLLAVPLPSDPMAWDEATRAFAGGDMAAYAEAATAMYLLQPDHAAELLAWWRGRAKPTWPREPEVR